MEVICFSKNAGPSVCTCKYMHWACSPAVFVLLASSLDFIWGLVTLINQNCTVISSLSAYSLPYHRIPHESVWLSSNLHNLHLQDILAYIHFLSFQFMSLQSLMHGLKWFFLVCGHTSPTSLRMMLTMQKMTCPLILLLCVFVAVRTCLLSRCLAMIRGIYIQTHRLVGGIYKVHHWDGFRRHDIHTEFHKDQFRHSKVVRGAITQTAWWSHAYFYFFKVSQEALNRLLLRTLFVAE
jgi:hypothetical protein